MLAFSQSHIIGGGSQIQSARSNKLGNNKIAQHARINTCEHHQNMVIVVVAADILNIIILVYIVILMLLI